MPGPAEVVLLAAEVADAARRGVDEPHVAELDLLHQPERPAVLERRDGAAAVGRLLALGDDLLLRPLHRLEAGGVVLRLRERALRAADAVGHVGEAGEEAHAADAAARLDLLGPRAGDESVGEVVLLGSRRQLDRREGAVVVRQDEPLGGDERAGAAADVDDRREEAAAGPVPEIPGRQRQPPAGELSPPRLAERGESLGGPLPLVGGGGGGEKEDGQDGGEEEGGAEAQLHGHASGGHPSPPEAAAPPPGRVYFVSSAKKAFIASQRPPVGAARCRRRPSTLSLPGAGVGEGVDRAAVDDQLPVDAARRASPSRRRRPRPAERTDRPRRAATSTLPLMFFASAGVGRVEPAVEADHAGERRRRCGRARARVVPPKQ